MNERKTWYEYDKSEDYESEFGRGLVIPLVKFSEHLGVGASGSDSVYNESMIHAYSDWVQFSQEERNKIMAEAVCYPNGDAADRLRVVELAHVSERVTREMHLDWSEEEILEDTLSRIIEMWMHAASDHFYDLDEDKAPQPLKKISSSCSQNWSWLHW